MCTSQTIACLFLLSGFALLGYSNALPEQVGYGVVNIPASPATVPVEIPSSFTGVVEVSVQGEKLLHKANGFTNKFMKTTMPIDAKFRIGSNSKLFVTVALYQLQEKGVLSISDSVANHLTATDFENFGHPAVKSWCPRVLSANDTSPCTPPTIEQLLSMGSGVIDVTNCRYPSGSQLAAYCWNGKLPQFTQLVDGFYSGSLAKIIGMFIMNPLASLPGSAYHYTNENFVLASYIVEKYTGMGLGKYLDLNVLRPLGLDDTHLDNVGPQFSVKKYSKLAYEYMDFYDSETHEYLDSGLAAFEFAPGSISGAGGMFSTTDDMSKWYSTLFSDKPVVLTVESVKEIVKPRLQINHGARGHSYYSQGAVVQLYNATSGWPSVILYEGGTFNCWTQIVHAPAQGGWPRPGLTATAFSSVSRWNVTSSDYYALAEARHGSFKNMLKHIAKGFDDGGANELANELFHSYSRSLNANIV